MDQYFIKEFWNENASLFKESHAASWKDTFCIELERETIAKHLQRDTNVLDVGCANGHSTIELFKRNNISKITGIDFSENMIKYANENKKNSLLLDDNRISFNIGDIRNIKFNDETFDAVYTTRVLINLPNWEEQKRGIEECLRVTKKGGVIILCEAFWEPLALLNAIRRLLNLDMLVEHDYNRYIKQNKLESFLNSKNIDYEQEDFSSIYYLGTRVLREITTDIDNSESYGNDFNRIFFEIEKKYSSAGMGIQQAYIIKK